MKGKVEFWKKKEKAGRTDLDYKTCKSDFKFGYKTCKYRLNFNYKTCKLFVEIILWNGKKL